MQEEIKCPFCKNAMISVLITKDTYSRSVAHAFGKSKSIPKLVKGKIEVDNNCPSCGKSKDEIKRALETGITRELSHEERLKRLREAGLPTRIESKH